MNNKESHFIYSLREMKRGATLGHVIDIRKHAIDYSKSTLACMNDVYALGIDMAMCAVGKIARAEDLGGVGVEGDRDGLGVESAGAGRDGVDDCAVTAVDAVEVAHGDDGWADLRSEFVERAENFHYAISKVS